MFVGVRSKCLDVIKLRACVPDFEYTSLEEGLNQLLEWEEKQNG